MAMYTLKGIGEISTDAFDEKITLRNLLQHFSFYDFIIVDTKQNILFQYNSNDDWFHNLISLKKFYNQIQADSQRVGFLLYTYIQKNQRFSGLLVIIV